MNEKDFNVRSITVNDLLSVLAAKWYLILLTALLGALVLFVKIQFFTPDVYRTNGILVVSNVDKSVDTEGTKFTASDMDSSRSLCASCIELLNTNEFYIRVSNELDNEISAKAISQRLKVSGRNETDLMDVTVVATDPETAYKLAKCVIETAPKFIEEIYDKDVVRAVPGVYEPNAPVDKAMFSNVLIGFFAGAVVGLFIVFLAFYFDDRVRSVEEVSKRYDIPVLGEINI